MMVHSGLTTSIPTESVSADLLARLEAAEVGSRELDAEIYDALYPRFTRDGHAPDGLPGRWPFVPGSAYDDEVQRVTTSLDAALALAERVLPTFTATIVKHRTNGGEFKPSSQANLLCVYGEIREHHGHASTPALALCVAILEARHAAAVSPAGHEGEAEVSSKTPTQKEQGA